MHAVRRFAHENSLSWELLCHVCVPLSARRVLVDQTLRECFNCADIRKPSSGTQGEESLGCRYQRRPRFALMCPSTLVCTLRLGSVAGTRIQATACLSHGVCHVGGDRCSDSTIPQRQVVMWLSILMCPGSEYANRVR